MDSRPLGRTGWNISPISYGAWAIGGDAWGKTDDAESLRSLHRAIDLGVNFIDTADVYGDGHSERLIARLRRERKEEIIVATKAGRRLNPHVAAGFTKQNLTAFVERSLRNLDTDALDLLQLHCPPPDVYDMPEVFGILDDLVADGKLRFYGVSVEYVEEALRAARYPNVQSIQIIFNMFRLKPAEELFPIVREKTDRHPRARAARQRAAEREAASRLHLRAARPPQLQSPRRGVRRRRDVQRRRLRDGPRRRSRSCARSSPPARRWRSSRSAGSSCSPRCRPRFPARRTCSRRRTTCARPIFHP